MDVITEISQEASACICGCDENSTERTDKLKSDLISRLNRVEGQIRGIKSMIDKDIYCDNILNQIAAAHAALESVGKLILKNHIQGCVVGKIKNGDTEIVDELLTTIGKML